MSSVNDPPPSAVLPGDAGTVAAAQDVLAGRGTRGAAFRVLPFLGPAFIACVAYVDPGNFATNIQGGAQYGYLLLWVVVASNLMAMLVQVLSAKLGIASGHNLAELCREHYPRWLTWTMWVLMEVVAMATDLAEFVGAAVGFNLLLGVPLWLAGILTALTTFLILGLQRYGFRRLEAVIAALVGVIAACYLVETILVTVQGKLAWSKVLYHAVTPAFSGTESVLLAAGILGATVMPHVIFVHSALTQGRIRVTEPARLKRLYRFQIVDVALAMGLAGLINAAMLVMAAATFYPNGLQGDDAILEAYRTLGELLGRSAPYVFGISLLAAGLSSSAVGTMAGQIIMQGFLRYQIPIWVRRLVTIVPSLIVLLVGLNPTKTLVLSQVVLSFGLPFAVVPLVLFTRRRDVMGVLVNRRATTLLAGLVALLIIGLNVFLLWETFSG